MKKTFAYFIIIFLSSSIPVKAQDLTITGIVLSSDGSFLPETSIALKGDTTYHTRSDKDGKYVLNLKSSGNDTLIFSYIGHEKQEVTLNNQKTIITILTKSNTDHNEIAQVTYGTRKRVIVLPVEIPNAYKRDNSIEIPNAYRSDKDESIEIPNADSKDQSMPFIKQK